MGAIEISIIVIASAIVVAVVIGAIVRKAKGKSSCCSDCSYCSHAKACQEKLAEVRAEKAKQLEADKIEQLKSDKTCAETQTSDICQCDCNSKK